METFLGKLINTFIFLRPYVLVFFIVYLVGSSAQFGYRKTIIFAFVGYFLAWLSEFASIHIGIPYGHYYYIYTTKDIELWVFGVPLMDSMSFVFLAYASYSMALFVVCPVVFENRNIFVLETKRHRQGVFTRVLGAILFMYLDIIIDPVALQGNKWFLGQIYGYAESGEYFGIPLSNFIGWFVVGFFLIMALQKIDAFFVRKGVSDKYAPNWPFRYVIGPGLYYGIFVFNITVTFFIKEYNTALSSVFIVFIMTVLILVLTKYKLENTDFKKAIYEYSIDFPEAKLPKKVNNVME